MSRAARQCSLPLHSRSAIHEKILANSPNLALFFGLNPVLLRVQCMSKFSVESFGCRVM